MLEREPKAPYFCLFENHVEADAPSTSLRAGSRALSGRSPAVFLDGNLGELRSPTRTRASGSTWSWMRLGRRAHTQVSTSASWDLHGLPRPEFHRPGCVLS